MASFSTRINEMRKKKNFIAKDLMTTKYKTRIVKPKKGKGSFKRKKNKLNSSTNNLNNF